VVQIFEPLEVRASYTAAVCEHVGHSDDASCKQSLFSAESSGAVGTLNDDLALEVCNVVLVDSLLLRGGDQDVAFVFHELCWV
jgi:hypothetical protein